MTHEQFVMWLHGFQEITNGRCPTSEEWAVIKAHVDLFFNNVTGRPANVPPVEIKTTLTTRVPDTIKKSQLEEALEQIKQQGGIPSVTYPYIPYITWCNDQYPRDGYTVTC